MNPVSYTHLDVYKRQVIDEAIQNNAQAVADYKNGKAKAIQSVFGACMRELKGICLLYTSRCV